MLRRQTKQTKNQNTVKNQTKTVKAEPFTPLLHHHSFKRYFKVYYKKLQKKHKLTRSKEYKT